MGNQEIKNFSDKLEELCETDNEWQQLKQKLNKVVDRYNDITLVKMNSHYRTLDENIKTKINDEFEEVKKLMTKLGDEVMLRESILYNQLIMKEF